uniref:CID domain-containing protein n=1 Tax=Hanusia phi TaxID=3032 RepID=A0A7S0F4U7_9CRYP|mmetsp:Transcript_4125/g.9982  ORF Transcript_4125/g.9982 Transcript_4125/m.9982 type:complete len:333 (+) Transcript_4125:51-1049(+)
MSGADGQNNFVKKLNDLNPSTVSVQTLSKWMIFNYKHAANLVRTWHKEILQVKPDRKLTFLYLANDVLQQSRKKHQEFLNEFAKVLPGTFADVAKSCESIPKIKESSARLISIWEERDVYSKDFLQKCSAALKGDFTASSRETVSMPDTKEKAEMLEPVAKLNDVLLRHQSQSNRTDDSHSKIENLPPEIFQVNAEETTTTDVSYNIAQSASQVLEAGVANREEYKKLTTQSIEILRDLLKDQMAKFQDNEKWLNEHTAVLVNLKQYMSKIGTAAAPASGGGRPPPLADSDDDEPSPKRLRGEDWGGGEAAQQEQPQTEVPSAASTGDDYEP